MARKNKKRKAPPTSLPTSKYFTDEGGSGSDDWVEIKEEAELANEFNEQDPAVEDIKIVINSGRITKKNEYMERLKKVLLTEFRRIHNNSNLRLHILNLIVWVIYVAKLNEIIEQPLYKALVMSFFDDEVLDLAGSSSFDVEKFLLWFKRRKTSIFSSLIQCVQPELPMNGSDYLVLAAFLRQLGLVTRLIVSFQPWNPKVDSVKSRNRFAYKKQDDNVEESQKSKNSDQSDSEDAPTTRLKKKMPLGHREMLSIINVCDPFNLEENENDAQKSNPKKSPSAYKKKIDPEFGYNYWIEVYIESTKSWTCIGGWDMVIDDPFYIAKCATNPLQYVVAVDQYGGWSDVTFKYSPEWLTATKKLRIVENWWQKFLKLNQGSDKSARGLKADRKLLKLLENQSPVPSKISDCKNHPHYVLERDLLKYQILYPDPPPIVGYIKDIPVYSRENVFTLQSKERWLIKEGRMVIEGSQCIKTGERRFSNKEGDIELYGKWQTTKIKPTLTSDGKLPKNSFGNIELYKPWMLPRDCVHLPIPGVLRVAKKLGIDAAPAVVGWKYCSHPHPAIDGIIILEKDKDLLLEEWQKHQVKERQAALLKKKKAEERIKKEEQKIKRAEEKAKAIFSKYKHHEDNE